MRDETKLCHLGRPHEGLRMVNPAVERGSTVVFPSYDDFRARGRPKYYGRHGTDTHEALREAVKELEGAEDVALTSSGLSAVNLALLAYARPGTEVLITDSTYDPVRSFCDQYLALRGVEVRYYDPLIGGDIGKLITERTALIHCESPGSLTFEVQDLHAICEAAGDIPVTVDNTWGAGHFYKPLQLGATISIQSATKYLGGHSDVFLGTIASRTPNAAKRIFKTAQLLGNATSPDDAYTVLRGMRTLHVRLAEHEVQGLALARWLEGRGEVARVLHPGLESHPQHDLWRRDFTGASGLFSVVLKRGDEAYVRRLIDSLNFYALGYSWGGYESLCLPAWPAGCRSSGGWEEEGQVLRFHAGLEAIEDLTADLDQAFAKANQEPLPAP
jgi:cystathionine beta-lyase